MTNEQAIAAAIARVREADRESHASRVAFATGNFPAYMKAKADAIHNRLDAEYRENSTGGNGEAGSGSGGGAGSGR